MTHDDLDRLAHLERQVTPGLWVFYEGTHGRTRRYWDVLVETGDADIATLTVAEMADLREDAANAEFIVALRNAAPALIAAARERAGPVVPPIKAATRIR